MPASATVRAELAAVLLNSGRYAEAAREYQRLVEIDGHNVGYRLGLARALAWDRRYREAEAHLRVLGAQRPGNAAVDTLLRSVRSNITPSAREAESWLAERPSHSPYRLALARALVREGRAQLALGHYHVLLADGATVDVLRETAEAHTEAGDPAGGIAVVERHLARAPWDADIRRTLALLLAADAQFAAALAHNDTLQSSAHGPDVLIDRARIEIMRGDLPAAEDNLRSSLLSAPTAEAYLILGDVHRWQREFADARIAYDGARVMNPGDRAVAAAFAQLARDERPAPVGVPAPNEETGWRVHGAALHDNAGIDYVRLGARRGVDLPHGLTTSVGVEYRTLHETTPSEEIASHGFAADVALAGTATYGSLLGSIGGHAGVVHHIGEDVMTMGGLVLRGGYQAWITALEIATGPAYPTLLTGASLVSSAGDEPLRERRLTLSAGGPIGPADAAITWHGADISDGNRRSSINLSARYPLARNFSALYAGSSISYAERSQLYWDPDEYLSSGAGIGYTNRSRRGFSFAAYALLGLARTEGSPFLRAPIEQDDATSTQLQLNLASELAYRHDRWDVVAAFGFGRVSRYERSDAAITVRVVP